jgi:hypothetical protein
MKRIIAAFAVLFSTFAAASAQESLYSKLSLTPEQKSQWETIQANVQKREAEIDATEGKNLDKRSMKLEAQLEGQSKFEQLLTAEQRNELAQLKAAAKSQKVAAPAASAAKTAPKATPARKPAKRN